jgi:hypothetical protein
VVPFGDVKEVEENGMTETRRRTFGYFVVPFKVRFWSSNCRQLMMRADERCLFIIRHADEYASAPTTTTPPHPTFRRGTVRDAEHALQPLQATTLWGSISIAVFFLFCFVLDASLLSPTHIVPRCLKKRQN